MDMIDGYVNDNNDRDRERQDQIAGAYCLGADDPCFVGSSVTQSSQQMTHSVRGKHI